MYSAFFNDTELKIFGRQTELEHQGCEPSTHYYTTKILLITLTSNYRGHSRLRENTRTISNHVTGV